MTKPKRIWPRVPDPATARAHVLAAEQDDLLDAIAGTWRWLGALAIVTVLDHRPRKDQQ
jgi:hypothetical protein